MNGYGFQDLIALAIVFAAAFYLTRKMVRIGAPRVAAPVVVLGERLRRGLERSAR